jgi:hypothetical protein
MKTDEEELQETMREAMRARGAEMPADGAARAEALPIDWSTEPTPAAANGAQVLHGPTQFALLFTDMAMFPGRNAPGGEVGKERARVVASLRLDPDTYFQTLCVLASNWNKFVETHVDPRMRQPRFKLIDAGEAQLYGIKKPKDDE